MATPVSTSLSHQLLPVYRSLLQRHRGFPSGSAVKNLPAVQETQEIQVGSLGWEDPLEEGMTTHSSSLSWRIPWIDRILADYSPWSRKE